MGKNYTYRFKTEREFIEEFGGNWISSVSWNNEHKMDYLFGIDIDVPPRNIDNTGYVVERFNIPNLGYNGSSASFTGWVINNRMLVKKIVPTYEPKKFIYE